MNIAFEELREVATSGTPDIPVSDILRWLEKAEKQEASDTAYRAAVRQHGVLVAKAERTLIELAQQLCPGYWVFQIEASYDHGKGKDVSMTPVYHASVSNGDDNVTGTGKTIAAAVAGLVYGLLSGGVFPLGGNGGRYIAEQDRTK